MPFWRTMKSAPTSSETTPKATSVVRASVPGLRGVGDGQIAHDTQHRAIEQCAGQHGRDRRRAFAMGVRQPGMHGGETDLGPVADQHQQERQGRQRRIHLRRGQAQRVPCHVVGRAKHEAAAPIEQHCSEQCEADAGGDEDDVFPRRLDTLGRALEADQEGADQRGQFDRDPVEPGIVHDCAQQNGERKAGKQRVEAPKPIVFAEQTHVADRIDRGEQIDDCRAQDHPGAGQVEHDIAAPIMIRSACAQHRERDGGHEDNQAGHEIDAFRSARNARQQATGGRSQRRNHHH